MRTAIIWDVEFLSAPGAPQRFWCGPNDPDPVLAQIGAVALDLTGDCELGATFDCVVVPRDRAGRPYDISDFFAGLTGITAARVADEGVELGDALARFDAFTQGAPIWAWGNDEIFAVAISCYLAGIAPPIPATRFGNATRLFQVAGIALDEIHGLRSNTLAGHFGIPLPEGRAHDALFDATSTALALRHLLRAGRLTAQDFALQA